MDPAKNNYGTLVSPDLSPHNHPKDPFPVGVSATSPHNMPHHTQPTGPPSCFWFFEMSLIWPIVINPKKEGKLKPLPHLTSSYSTSLQQHHFAPHHN
jgi:hypothetical protein